MGSEETLIKEYIIKEWVSDCIPKISEYVRIPNLSPFFDKECLTNGLMDSAMDLIQGWVKQQQQFIVGMEISRIQEPGRTPLLFIEIPAFDPNVSKIDNSQTGTVLMYGHMDKQPPFLPWKAGLNPYNPVIQDGKLYGRGAADDGYSVFCALLSIKALQKHKIAHSKIVVIIEACEESGSPDLPFYISKLKDEDKMEGINLIVCLDSGCGNYEQLWITSSLRGLVGGHLCVETLREGVHSGDASGIVPETFRIMRQLLSRLEDQATGNILDKRFWNEDIESSEKLRNKVKMTGEILGVKGVCMRFPFLNGVKTVTDDVSEMCMNRWFRPQLVITGVDGLPPCESAGNVMRPKTRCTLSLRIPPGVDAKQAAGHLKELLLSNPPYGAHLKFESEKAADGWMAPDAKPWLENAVQEASQAHFSKPALYQGEGGSIPFMAMLGKLFPRAQFMVTGVLGPESNAHGPNEFLHIDFSAKLTCCVSMVLRRHYESKVEVMNREDVNTDSHMTKNEQNGTKKMKLDEEYLRGKDGTKM